MAPQRIENAMGDCRRRAEIVGNVVGGKFSANVFFKC